jgi:hypothetical protein
MAYASENWLSWRRGWRPGNSWKLAWIIGESSQLGCLQDLDELSKLGRWAALASAGRGPWDLENVEWIFFKIREFVSTNGSTEEEQVKKGKKKEDRSAQTRHKHIASRINFNCLVLHVT